MKLHLIVIAALLLPAAFLSCTKSPPVEQPAVKAALQTPVAVASAAPANECERFITSLHSKLRSAKIKNTFSLRPELPLLCKVDFVDGQKLEQAVFVVKGEMPKLLISTGELEMPECGATTKDFKTTLVELKVGDAVDTALAIEEITSVIGCCGQADKVRSNIYLYDTTTERLSSPLKASEYCMADKNCDGRCEKSDKAAVDHGDKVSFDFDRCTEAEPCSQIHFSKSKLGKSIKPSAYVLTWDKNLTLKTSSF